MSAYLKFFQLEHAPFEAGPENPVVLGTKALRDAFAQIESGLDEGAPRICVNGGSGLGKTSLARALPKLLDGRGRVVVLLNPALPWAALRGGIVRQLDLEGGVLSRKTLLARRDEGERLVIVIDAAERIDRESLEHMDILLGYRTDADEQLVHCVLLANLDRAQEQADCPLMWWLDTLNTLQLEFAPIPVAGVRSYIVKHLKRAGWNGGDLFTAEAAQAIHRITGGVPRSVSALCEEVLEAAAERQLDRIGSALVEEVSGEGPADAGAGDGEAGEVVLDAVISRFGFEPADGATDEGRAGDVGDEDSPFGWPDAGADGASIATPEASARVEEAGGRSAVGARAGEDAGAGLGVDRASDDDPRASDTTDSGDQADGQPSPRPTSTAGLDAFFGPVSERPATEGPPTLELTQATDVAPHPDELDRSHRDATNDAADVDDANRADFAPYGAELDVESGGGATRWAAAVVVVAALVLGGLYAGGMLPGASEDEAVAADTRTADDPGHGDEITPSAQERLSALTQSDGPRVPAEPTGDGRSGDTGSSADSNKLGTLAHTESKGIAARDGDEIRDAPEPRMHDASSPAPPAPPASPARADPMDRANERHF